MITINLLPPKEIRQLKLLKLHRFLLKRILILSGFGILLILLFLGSDFYLRRNLNTIGQQLEEKMSEVNISNFLELQGKIDQFNQDLEKVSRLQAKHIQVAPFLVELGRLTPGEVRLTSLKVFRKTAQIELTGVARERDHLLDFQENLEQSDYFQSIESPLSNLTSKEDVEFRLIFKMKGEIEE